MIEALLSQAYQQYSASHRDEAARICRQILATMPDCAEAIYLLAVIDSDSGQLSAAVEGFARAVSLQPRNAVFHNTLGETLHRLGRLDEAWTCYQRSIKLRPTYERAHNNSGRLLNEKGDPAAAVACFTEAVRLNPNYATALNNLGGALLTLKNFSEAVSYLQRAITLQPDYPEAHYNLAAAFQPAGDVQRVLIHVDRAIQLRPDYAHAHLLMGKVLFDLGQVDRSVRHFQTYIKLQPDNVIGHLELGTAQLLSGQLETARDSFRKVLALAPSHPHAFAQLFQASAMLMDWSTRDTDLERLANDVAESLRLGEPSPVAPLHALSLPWDGDQLLAIARSHAKLNERTASQLQQSTPGFSAASMEATRIRIGYLSRDFYDHPVAHQIKGVFALHDRSRFDVHVYSFGPDDGSVYRQQIAQTAAHFHDVSRLNDQQLYQQIQADGIQILIDLMGYTGFAKTRCLANRPAPIQVSWLGYPSTMGADFIDYLIGDAVVTPLDHDEFYHEAVVRLPHSYMPTDHAQPIVQPLLDRSQYQLPAEVPVFCCFNNSYKITPEIFHTWMSILRRVPGSVAWLNISHPVACENLRKAAREAGIDIRRLIFANRVPDKGAHLARLTLADLFLDTPLYNAHSTACDVLWTGVPIVTCLGKTFQSRVAASLLTAVGLNELIAEDLDQYEQLTIELINDPSRLLSIRGRLAEQRLQLPLFNTPRFVQDLERAFIRMWEIYSAGRPPEGFSL